ncbi:MAG: hypothetical protein ABIK63_06280 [candidate division WOR-3 bacterium]
MNILNKFSIFRIIVTILLLFIILNITFNFFISKKPKIFVFLDSSLSMEEEKKFPQAINFLEILKKEVKDFKIFTFGETIKEVSSLANLSCQEKRTDFNKVFDIFPLKKPDIVLILSDGLHNSGSFSLTEKLPFPIHTIGFGTPALYDFSISDVNYPNFTFVNETVKVIFRIKSSNLKGLLPVFLISDEKIIQKKELNFLTENVILEDSFKIIFSEEGKKFLTLKIPDIKEEVDHSNNQYFLTITVKKKLAKILYLSNQPTFNLKFIRKNLETNPDYQADFVYTFEKRNLNLIMKDYEVIIFDNFDFSVLKDKEKEMVNNLIKKAKGILFLVDKNVNFTNFSEYLPISPEKIQPEKEVYFRLTEKGKENIVLENILNEINNLPPFSGYLKGKPKENTEVLLITEKDSSPLFSYHFYQNKIIALFSGFPFWRWLFVSDELLQTKLSNFFLSLISFLKEGKYRINISLEKEVFNYPEEIKIKVIALNEIGKPARDLNIVLEIPKYEIRQVFNEVADGLYQTNFLPPDTGEIPLKISVFKEKEKIKEENIKLKILLELEEKKTPYLDTLFLKSLAQKSNGDFYLYPNVPTTFTFLEEKKRINLKIYFQNNFYIYLILISLYILDIYLRKRKGLP